MSICALLNRGARGSARGYKKKKPFFFFERTSTVRVVLLRGDIGGVRLEAALRSLRFLGDVGGQELNLRACVCAVWGGRRRSQGFKILCTRKVRRVRRKTWGGHFYLIIIKWEVDFMVFRITTRAAIPRSPSRRRRGCCHLLRSRYHFRSPPRDPSLLSCCVVRVEKWRTECTKV